MGNNYRRGLALVVALSSACAQSKAPAISIDSDRPYVLIAFDHVGPREPLTDQEEKLGIWLRLRNNSRWPIEVGVYSEARDGGYALLHEVVGVHNSVRPHPTGYNTTDVVNNVEIPSGRDVLFSVPANHIRPDWFIRVKFEFQLPPVRAGRQPYSFVDLTWTEIPSQVRRQLDTP